MLMEADLPDDVDALRALVLEQARKLESADAEAERLRAIIEAFRRHRFGRRSEQLDQDQLQLGLEDAETALAEAEAASEAKAVSWRPPFSTTLKAQSMMPRWGYTAMPIPKYQLPSLA